MDIHQTNRGNDMCKTQRWNLMSQIEEMIYLLAKGKEDIGDISVLSFSNL